jgi:hypothetical protein
MFCRISSAKRRIDEASLAAFSSCSSILCESETPLLESSAELLVRVPVVLAESAERVASWWERRKGTFLSFLSYSGDAIALRDAKTSSH